MGTTIQLLSSLLNIVDMSFHWEVRRARGCVCVGVCVCVCVVIYHVIHMRVGSHMKSSSILLMKTSPIPN